MLNWYHFKRKVLSHNFLATPVLLIDEHCKLYILGQSALEHTEITFIKLLQGALIPKDEKYCRYTKKIKSPRAKYFCKSHLKNGTSTNQVDLTHTALKRFGCAL